MGQDGVSYVEQRTAGENRLRYLRAQMRLLNLFRSPPMREDCQNAFLSGYEAALRDLAFRPEVMRKAADW